jgi:glycosyltransferase involved in cell wall biosynthesis
MAVAVTVDGRWAGHAAAGSELRPDVAEATGQPLEESGWQVWIDLTDEEVSETVIGVWVWPGPDLSPILLEIPVVRGEVPVDPALPHSRLHGWLDLPAEMESVERGPLVVWGWALFDDRPVSRVAAIVDGGAPQPVRLGVDRLDVIDHFDVPHACISGFQQLIDLSAVPEDVRTVDLEIRVDGATALSETIARRQLVLGPVKDRAEPSVKRRAILAERLSAVWNAPESKELNLLVFTHDLGLGGGQLWLSELLKRSGAGQRYPCTVVSPTPGPLLDELEALGIEVHVTQAYPFREFESYEGRIVETASWMACRSHTAVLVNTFGAFFGADLATRLGLPTVWAIHESWTPETIWAAAYPSGAVHPDVRAAGMAALIAVDALVFESEETRKQYEHSARPGRTFVVPYGVDTTAIESYMARFTREQARSLVGIDPDDMVLLIMGTTEIRKGQTLLAEAFAEVIDEYSNALLVFVGDTATSYAQALSHYIESVGLVERTRLVPVVENTYIWYRAADVLVCASDIESLPRTVLEAMAFGVPVAATRVFGLAELITDGETGFLHEPLDLTATIAALRRVLALDQSELEQVGAAGRRLVTTHHDSAGYARDILVLLDSLRRRPGEAPDKLLAESRRPD